MFAVRDRGSAQFPVHKVNYFSFLKECVTIYFALCERFGYSVYSQVFECLKVFGDLVWILAGEGVNNGQTNAFGCAISFHGYC